MVARMATSSIASTAPHSLPRTTSSGALSPAVRVVALAADFASSARRRSDRSSVGRHSDTPSVGRCSNGSSVGRSSSHAGSPSVGRHSAVGSVSRRSSSLIQQCAQEFNLRTSSLPVLAAAEASASRRTSHSSDLQAVVTNGKRALSRAGSGRMRRSTVSNGDAMNLAKMARLVRSSAASIEEAVVLSYQDSCDAKRVISSNSATEREPRGDDAISRGRAASGRSQRRLDAVLSALEQWDAPTTASTCRTTSTGMMQSTTNPPPPPFPCLNYLNEMRFQPLEGRTSSDAFNLVTT